MFLSDEICLPADYHNSAMHVVLVQIEMLEKPMG